MVVVDAGAEGGGVAQDGLDVGPAVDEVGLLPEKGVGDPHDRLVAPGPRPVGVGVGQLLEGPEQPLGLVVHARALLHH